MKKSFNTGITAAHPIVNDHAVYGQRILPGLGYIDMVYQLGQAALGLDPLKHTLHRISIHNPLVVGEQGHVALRIGFEPMNRGWKVTVEGTEITANGGTGPDKLYMTAELLEESRELSLRVSVADAQRSALSRVDLESIYANARARGLEHRGLMKASGAVYRSSGAYLIETRMDSTYRELSQTMLFHPTLIDSAAVAMGFLDESLEGAHEQDLFIPLYFESFHANAPMRSDGYAWVDQSTFRRVNDILTVDIAYLDAQGNQVALLKGVTSKRVRFKEQIAATSAAPAPAKTQATSTAPVAVSASISSPQELEGQVRNVFGRYLQLEPAGIDVNTGFYELGLESSQLLSLVRDLEKVSGASLQPTLLFEYTTISELCTYIAGVMPQQQHTAAAKPEVAATFELPVQSREELPAAALRTQTEDIAVIGMAGRFPDADNLQEFWANLVAGKDCITEIPSSRWDWRQYENVTSPTGKKVSKWGGFLNDPDYFDPSFFRISPREAEVLDPQERLFLETCWEAMEDAGYTPKTLVPPRGPNQRRPVGVFVGAMHKDYAMIGSEAFAQGQLFALSLQNAPIANRVSYFCNFHGPSMAIDTLCSSSLTALHLAMESLHSGESEVAIAGGVNLCLHPHKYLSYGMLDFFSSDGYCHTFGKGGDGYVPGEGVGAVILKPLSQAVRDGDSIYAVIKGSTVNHVGTVSGITVPSPVAQADLIRECFEKTKVDPRTISYVEAHGTGTSLGDPIEIDGLVKSYRPYTSDTQFCAIGSVKSNIGHAESAAGISGLMKTILQLHHKTLVPSLHSEEINPLIDFAQTPFYVQQKTEPWQQPEIVAHNTVVQVPRRAAVSSFGATGSNAHVILEEYVAPATSSDRNLTAANQPTVIPLSAKSSEQLVESAGRLLQFLKGATAQPAPVAAQLATDHGLRAELEGKLRTLVSEVVNVEESDVDTRQEWSEYGIDLVQLMQIRDRLLEAYNGQIELELEASSSIASVVESLVLADRPASEAPNLSANLPSAAWNHGDVNLQDLAYTLQVGREAMEERLVLIVQNLADLIQKLEKFVQSPADFKEGFRGQEKRSKDVLEVLIRDEDSNDLIRKWVQKGKLSSIADLWAKGYQMDWNLLYGHGKPRRLHLPTYPFAKERYWISTDANKSAGSGAAGKQVSAVLHPLLHQNTSDLSEQRFTSVFTGEEFFLSDHVVNGQRILPGVAHLEMARAAVERATGGNPDIAWKLENVVWIRPLVLEGSSLEVQIRLFPEGEEDIAYEIYTISDDLEETVFSQGRAVATPAASPTLDLAQWQAVTSQGSLSAEQCYETFGKMGLAYGPGHRGIQVVYTGENKALAKLSLPYSIQSTKNAYTLNPCLMDSALQATIGVTLGSGNTSLETLKPTLPFALEAITTYAPCPSEAWVTLSYSPGVKAGDPVQKYDIDLCDERGEICVSIKGFTMRVLDGKAKAGGSPSGHVAANPLYPVWTMIPEARGVQLPSTQDGIVIIGGSSENVSAIRGTYPHAHHISFHASDDINSIANNLQSIGEINHLIWIAPPIQTAPTDEEVILGQADGLYPFFRLIKAVLQLGYGKKKLGWSIWTMRSQLVLETDAVNAVHAAIYGLAGSMAKEYMNWSIRLVDLPDERQLPLQELFTLPVDRQARPWAYRDGMWFQQQLLALESPSFNQTAYRKDGVYVVIGGAGSVGEMWTEYMIRTYNARVIWIGRRKLDATIQAQLDRLAAFGPAPRYLSADAGNLQSLTQAYAEIKAVEPQIHGIVHSTMVLLDQSLANMEEQELRNVLVSKVDVSVRVAQVFQQEALDFVLFFSSLMAFTKAPNQSSYAAGCTFVDAFAHQVAQVWPCKVKVINWGYWGRGDGGVIDAETHQALAETYTRLANIGIGLIEPGEAMAEIEKLLVGPVNQMGFMKTTKPILIEGVNPEEKAVVDANGKVVRQSTRPTPVSVPVAPKPESAPQQPVRANTSGQLKDKTTAYLKKLVGDTLKISVNKLDATEPLETYGIDSIIIVELTNALRDVFGEIPSTLFFECQTIDELVEYFLKSRKDALSALLGAEDSNQETAQATTQPQAVPTPAIPAASRKKSRRFAPVAEVAGASTTAKTSSIQDIAIIGLAGRYPQANDLHEFWEKLAGGVNCITEIPEDRWDWQKYYHPERGREGSMYTKWGGFLKNIDGFDPLFFNISPREAKTMDPQERLFLEVAYSSIEDAGYTPSTLNERKRVGVFVGVMNSNYPAGTAYWSIANRLSYLLNFRGPSMAVDTACSSSLTALHLALESLYSGTSECAIVGGVNLIVDPFHYLRLTSQNMLSPGNRCNTFGEQADGFVDSEAVGAVLLKPLQKAVADGDHIYGVIKGSMINSGGKTNGYTVPNPNAQFQLVAEALQRAGVHARTVSYVEAHGTGTALGDPIEIEGLRQAYELDTADKQYCSIGSVKSNIGHSESAAGIAGLTKILLQLKHGHLVPSLNSEVLNPRIQFANTPFTVQHELVPWERPVVEIDGQSKEYPRIAGLSSFGAGGSNAHVIIEEYIPDAAHAAAVAARQLPVPIVLSAKTEEQLQESAARLLAGIRNNAYVDGDLASIAYTLQVGREAMDERLGLIVSSLAELEEKLQGYLDQREDLEHVYQGQVKRNKEALLYFTTDEDLMEAVDKWISSRKYAKLIDLWVKGLPLDWSKFHDGEKPRRISLPTYPFAKGKYWLTPSEIAAFTAKSTTRSAGPSLPVAGSSNAWEKQGTTQNLWNYVLYTGKL